MTEKNENDVIKEAEEIDQSNDESSDAPAINEDQMESMEPSNDSNLQIKIDEHWDQILRLQAEIENLRKRNIKDIESAAKTSIERVFQEILPVIDSFEIGMTIDTESNEGMETFIAGQQATYKQFISMLEKFSIEVIDPQEMKFDSDNHEAMSMIHDENTEPGYVVGVIQKGYRLQNRLLRPARVIVSAEAKKD